MTAIEVAVESLASALAAEAGGASRLELCADLAQGGVTPSASLTAQVMANTTIPIFAMVRPRVGDFVYRNEEVAAMRRTIDELRTAGVHGFVLGALTKDNAIDTVVMRELLTATEGMPVTFHRAFDRLNDQKAGLEGLIALGIPRVLTSGGAQTALEGAEALRQLVAQAGDRIRILAGGGLRENNVQELVRRTGAREVHTKLKERAHEEVDQKRVRAFVNAVRGATA